MFPKSFSILSRFNISKFFALKCLSSQLEFPILLQLATPDTLIGVSKRYFAISFAIFLFVLQLYIIVSSYKSLILKGIVSSLPPTFIT